MPPSSKKIPGYVYVHQSVTLILQSTDNMLYILYRHNNIILLYIIILFLRSQIIKSVKSRFCKVCAANFAGRIPVEINYIFIDYSKSFWIHQKIY